METFMNNNCVPVTDALFRIFEYATSPEIYVMNGKRIHLHREAYNIAPCIFVSKLWNEIATKYLEQIRSVCQVSQRNHGHVFQKEEAPIL
jgi:hypothetical protein